MNNFSAGGHDTWYIFASIQRKIIDHYFPFRRLLSITFSYVLQKNKDIYVFNRSLKRLLHAPAN